MAFLKSVNVIVLFVIGFNVDMNVNADDVEVSLRCGPGHQLKTLKRISLEHVGDGGYIISVCCPIKHNEAVFFGREGVGCCQVSGRRCVFTCRCKDGGFPIKSKRPEVYKRMVNKSIREEKSLQQKLVI